MSDKIERREGGGKEFPFGAADFKRVRDMIYKKAGIALADSKHEMVYSRLSRRLRALNLETFTQYLDILESQPNSNEWESFTNSLTTNLTSFFRESHHFPILAEHAKSVGGPLNIWCSASSTGEEPYSIAITMCEAFGTLKPPVKIIATDIDTNVLRTCEAGVYPLERIEKMPKDQLKQFFLRGKGDRDGFVKVRKEVRDLITFRQLNLLGNDWPLEGPFDVIFCRNVMIYFDKPTQAKILSRFVPLMKPNALLFAGHSENFLYASNALKLRGKTVYELNDAARGKER